MFQSTRSVWGATQCAAGGADMAGVSIHAPRVGRDARTSRAAAMTTRFQSTRPVWGATVDGAITAME